MVVSAADPVRARAQRIWQSIWPSERLRQREFMTFGMEVILKLDLEQTRQFFSAFFALSDFHWRGFLSSRLSFTELFVFGLSLFAEASNAARINLIQAGFPLLPSMFASIVRAERQLPPNQLGQPVPSAKASAKA
jgi:lycopene beta-cyclase